MLTLSICIIGLSNCKKSSGGNNSINTSDTASAVNGDPTQNQFALASANEEILTVNPKNGTTLQSVYKFSQNTDVAGLDNSNGLIYSGAADNGVHAINTQTRALAWSLPLPDYRDAIAVTIIPVVQDGVCYSAGNNGLVIAADATTGTPKWECPVDPLYSNETEY